MQVIGACHKSKTLHVRSLVFSSVLRRVARSLTPPASRQITSTYVFHAAKTNTLPPRRRRKIFHVNLDVNDQVYGRVRKISSNFIDDIVRIGFVSHAEPTTYILRQ